MLKLMRNKKFAKKILYVLAAIIIPSFVFWGSASVIKERKGKGQKGYAGMIFGKKVSFEEFMNALGGWRNELRMKFGSQANQLEDLYSPNEAVWFKLILLSEAKRLKMKVNNAELAQYIGTLPFLLRDGRFSPELYELFLKYSLGTPVRIFEEQMRDTLKIQKLFDNVTYNVEASEDDIREKYKQDYGQIKVKYISVLADDLEENITLTEEEIKDYYEQNKGEFKIPMQVNLNYVGIDYPDDAADEQKSEVDEKIKQVREVVETSKKLSSAKDEFDLEINETGLFTLGDPMADFRLPTNEILPLFNLKDNQVSDIVQTDKGAYIFQLKNKLVDFSPEFEEVKEEVESKLSREKSKELAKTKIDDQMTKIGNEKDVDPDLDLTKIAETLDLTIKETSFFDRDSGPQEIGFFQEPSKAIFNLIDGEISPVIEFVQGYCIVEVSERKPIDEEKFQEEKEGLEKIVLREKQDMVFEDYFSKLKDQAGLVDYVSFQQDQEQPPPEPN